MTSRELPPAEWHRLDGTEAASVWRDLNPTDTKVLVVEREGQIVGSWLVMRLVHVECLWIAPAARKTASVGRRLLIGMKHMAEAWGARAVLTSSVSEDVRALIAKRGGSPLPGEMFVVPLGKDAPCQQ